MDSTRRAVSWIVAVGLFGVWPAGAVAQQTAEALAAVVLLQQVNPGCPVVMGSFTSNVDMKSGAPAFGTPEYMRATQMSGQMARLYNLPLRATNACAATACWRNSLPCTHGSLPWAVAMASARVMAALVTLVCSTNVTISRAQPMRSSEASRQTILFEFIVTRPLLQG